VPHTLIADNAAGLLMMQGKVDLVIVGADRIAANGDTANKVGTYLKALAARAHGVPFYVAAPLSTIDFACPRVRRSRSRSAPPMNSAPATYPVANPAFDVTPAALISGIISERGIAAAGALEQWRIMSDTSAGLAEFQGACHGAGDECLRHQSRQRRQRQRALRGRFHHHADRHGLRRPAPPPTW
jgi:translation initiation factor 2B subunit (eIF-2B alpha/beta/delta family)